MRPGFPILCFVLLLVIPSNLLSQGHINLNGSMREFSALLQVSASDRGFLMTGLTHRDRDYIYDPVPAEGLIIYNTEKSKFEYFNGSKWRTFARELSDKVNCGNDMIDERDGQVYGTVKIGEQCWMAENMNIGVIRDTAVNQIQNDTIEKYCAYNDPVKCLMFGGLYTWNEAMGYDINTPVQGICPDGWHIPSSAEWTELKNFLGQDGGNKTKEAGLNHWTNMDGETLNSTGFTALPAGGFAEYNGGCGGSCFYNVSNHTYFWSDEQCSLGSNIYAKVASLTSFDADFFFSCGEQREDAVSVRCIKD